MTTTSQENDMTRKDVQRLEKKVDELSEKINSQGLLLASIDERLKGNDKLQHQKIKHVIEKVDSLSEQVEDMKDLEVPTLLDNHEKRITALESSKNAVIGVIITAVIMAIMGLILI